MYSDARKSTQILSEKTQESSLEVEYILSEILKVISASPIVFHEIFIPALSFETFI